MRLREQGTVVINVYISAEGKPTQAKILTSSGFERLDQTALRAAKMWRYVPGKRNGVPEAMWVPVPVRFEIETN
jgi:protein TonB